MAGRTQPERRPGKPDYDVVTFGAWTPKSIWQAGIKRVSLGEPEWRHLPLPEVAALIGEEEMDG